MSAMAMALRSVRGSVWGLVRAKELELGTVMVTALVSALAAESATPLEPALGGSGTAQRTRLA